MFTGQEMDVSCGVSCHMAGRRANPPAIVDELHLAVLQQGFPNIVGHVSLEGLLLGTIVAP